MLHWRLSSSIPHAWASLASHYLASLHSVIQTSRQRRLLYLACKIDFFSL
uniref:Uncharacterized protein n=1 Tax=Manihot esculenta TaxID=3983 RepID=A0A2C9UQ14_MANES